MSTEECPEAEPRESSPTHYVPFQYLQIYWTSLDRGWQAVCLSAVLVLAVVFGLPIPW